MNHEVLGEIVRENGKSEGVAQVPYQGRTIQFNIAEDEVSYEEAIEIAASAVRQLEQLDARAKVIAAEGLTDGYNDGWNEYDEVQEDGSLLAVSNPELTREEFAAKLTLRSVNVTGNMVDFFYDDENMFWGHWVIVTSMNGVDFSEAYAQIFG